MKIMKALCTSILLAVSLVGFTQDVELVPTNGPILKFTEDIHDFGDIDQGDIVEHTFVFENTGNAPLIISNAQGSCGCTVPSYKKDQAIAPGETSDMVVRFNSRGKSGVQSKTVTIYSNAQNSPTKIRIKTSIKMPTADDHDSSSGGH